MYESNTGERPSLDPAMEIQAAEAKRMPPLGEIATAEEEKRPEQF